MDRTADAVVFRKRVAPVALDRGLRRLYRLRLRCILMIRCSEGRTGYQPCTRSGHKCQSLPIRRRIELGFA